MTKILRNYVFEIIIILISLVTALIEAFVVRDANFTILIVIIGTLLSISTVSLRKGLSEQIDDKFEIFRIIQEIEETKWRSDALEQLRKLTIEFQRWAQGVRSIPLDRSIPHQIALLKTANKEIQAIHIGIPASSLYLWDKHTGGFSHLVEAHDQLSSNIQKRRILVCDDNELLKEINGRRIIIDEAVIRICKRQVAEDRGGLGVDLRVLWRAKLTNSQMRMPPDMLIVDGQQAVVVRGDSGHYYDVEIIINPTTLRDLITTFDSCWETAEPVSHYLPG